MWIAKQEHNTQSLPEHPKYLQRAIEHLKIYLPHFSDVGEGPKTLLATRVCPGRELVTVGELHVCQLSEANTEY
jgi:hypothetical protein